MTDLPPQYPSLSAKRGTGLAVDEEVIDYLVDRWVSDYSIRWPANDLVLVTLDGFSHLFDVAQGRLVAAFGTSRGRHGGARDSNRMRWHPLGAGSASGYHRGHAIAHTLGGGLDINLVPQLGRVNIGTFRALERLAVATPGALYYTYWSYGDGTTQRPARVQQGLLIPGSSRDDRAASELSRVYPAWPGGASASARAEANPQKVLGRRPPPSLRPLRSVRRCGRPRRLPRRCR